jgi:hypothetical protein
MATYSNHGTSVFAYFHYGGCSWCMNGTFILWILFEDIEYNHYLFGDDKLICVVFVIFAFLWGYYFEKTLGLTSLDKLIWNSNTL